MSPDTIGTWLIPQLITELTDRMLHSRSYMSRLKFLISILSFLTITYHMAKLMAVITNNTSRTRPSSVIAWTTVSISLPL